MDSVQQDPIYAVEAYRPFYRPEISLPKGDYIFFTNYCLKYDRTYSE